MSRPLIIYHAPCTDGFGAAYAAWLQFGNEADYLPAAHGRYPDIDVTGRVVFVLDFSFPKETMLEMAKKAKVFQVIDHHKTAKEAVGDLPGAIFDMTKSGARLAWEFFHPTKPVPRLIQYIEDRDLWKWQYKPDSEFVLCYLDTVEYSFEEWHRVRLELDTYAGYAELKRTGAVMRQKEAWLAANQAKDGEPVLINGIEGTRYNGGGMFTNDIAHEFYEKNGTFGMLWRIEKGQLRVAFRSQTMDVSQLARKFWRNGGGHAAAAAFQMPITAPEFEPFFKTYILGNGK